MCHSELVLHRCKTCGEYIYKGKKFNARKETVQNEVYLGLPIFRFYIKCTRCLAEITFKVGASPAPPFALQGAPFHFIPGSRGACGERLGRAWGGTAEHCCAEQQEAAPPGDLREQTQPAWRPPQRGDTLC